jgi:hypothetical protein
MFEPCCFWYRGHRRPPPRVRVGLGPRESTPPLGILDQPPHRRYFLDFLGAGGPGTLILIGMSDTIQKLDGVKRFQIAYRRPSSGLLTMTSIIAFKTQLYPGGSRIRTPDVVRIRICGG